MRHLVDPDDPATVRILASLGARLQYWMSPVRRGALSDEIRRSFPHVAKSDRTVARVCKSAYDLQLQCLTEELLLGRLTPTQVGSYMRFDGRLHLDQALYHGKGVILVYPHAGNVMLLIALLSLSGYDYTQVAARGFPPVERRITSDLKPSWFNRTARQAREDSEDRLPAFFLPMEASPRRLYRALEKNGIVGIAFDGRGGERFQPTPFLGRTALLSAGPWKLAARTGAAIVPAICIRDRDRTHRLVLRPPVFADATLPLEERYISLQQRVLRDQIEPMLQRHPDHYARWLLHCRRHAAMDSHPLFTDYPETRS